MPYLLVNGLHGRLRSVWRLRLSCQDADGTGRQQKRPVITGTTQHASTWPRPHMRTLLETRSLYEHPPIRPRLSGFVYISYGQWLNPCKFNNLKNYSFLREYGAAHDRIRAWFLYFVAGNNRDEFNMKTSSDMTCTRAAKTGVRTPAAAKIIPDASTSSVPQKFW
jgi:hypothetical protein